MMATQTTGCSRRPGLSGKLSAIALQNLPTTGQTMTAFSIRFMVPCLQLKLGKFRSANRIRPDATVLSQIAHSDRG